MRKVWMPPSISTHPSLDISQYRFDDQPEVDYRAFSKRVEKMPFHQRQALCNSADAFWAQIHRYGKNQETLVKRVFIISE